MKEFFKKRMEVLKKILIILSQDCSECDGDLRDIKKMCNIKGEIK